MCLVVANSFSKYQHVKQSINLLQLRLVSILLGGWVSRDNYITLGLSDALGLSYESMMLSSSAPTEMRETFQGSNRP